MSRLPGSRSLLLTGIADVGSTLREDAREGGERSALILMIVSAAAFALMAASAKKLLPDTPTQAVVFSRGVMMSAIFLTMARWQGIPLLGKRPGILLLRGLLGYAALSCYFYSVQHLPLGDAVLLQYSHPIFVAMIAPFILGERSRGRDLWLILLALTGVALIVRPAGEIRVEALVGVLGSVFSGFAYIAVRRLSKTEHPTTILVWFPLASIPLSLVGVVAAGPASIPRDGLEVAGHLLVTLTALVGQVTLTLGLSRAGAARATSVTLAGPVFGMLLGLLFFGTRPTIASVIGMAIVLASLGVLGWRR